jgi:uncharacterized damage-inducible protein DinB
MSISESLLPEFDHELANTRRVLERVPEDRLGWKPHAKSYSLGELATHVTNLYVWAVHTIDDDFVDLGSPEAQQRQAAAASRAELLAKLDRQAAAARAAVVRCDDARWMQPWSLKHGERVLLTVPRIGCMRTFVMNHLIHHRAQLTVDLRLLDVPVPALYGPSADEQGMG